MPQKTAVIFFNLGGPDSPQAVQPFLFNLFNDPAIIRLPNPFRWLLAKLISTRRAPVAQEIYAKMGGRSPILPQTEAQARALEAVLGEGFRVFIAMRYWHPFSDETAKAVKDWGAERIVLLPLYPQFSTTTTASSFADWHRAAARVGLTAPTAAIGCYNDEPGFVAAQTALLRERLPEAEAKGTDAKTGVRILFSAHGLPKKSSPMAIPISSRSSAVLRRSGTSWGATTSTPASVTRAASARWNGSARPRMPRSRAQHRRSAPLSSCPLPLCPSIRKRWSSSISNTPSWPITTARLAISACPP